jgi:hypothetical protein
LQKRHSHARPPCLRQSVTKLSPSPLVQLNMVPFAVLRVSIGLVKCSVEGEPGRQTRVNLI